MRYRSVACVVLSVGLTIALAMTWSTWRVTRQLNEARRALEARDPEVALAILQKASELAPTRGELFFWMARAYRRQGRLEDVRRCLLTAMQLGVPNDRIQREEWLAMAQVGQMQEAGPHLSKLLVNPGDDGPEICEAYANGYLTLYRFDEAFEVVNAWQKDFPQDPQPHMFRGLVANQDLAWTAAAEHFQKALNLAPQRVDIRLRLANALLTLQQTSHAASHFQQLLKTCPNSSEVLTGWGRTLVEQGQLNQAREIFTKVLMAHPDDYGAILALGQLELNANHLEQALALLQQAVALNPDDPEVRNALAGALQRAGRASEARSHFEFVAKAQETNLRIQTLRERITASATDLEARYELSELLRDKRNQTDRIVWLRSIIEIDPKHQRAHAALAEHYEKTGNSDLALIHRTMSQSLSSDSVNSEHTKP